MPQTLSKILLHTVFSTKHRQPFLKDCGVRAEVHDYLGGTCKGMGYNPLIVGGASDHVHLLTVQSRTMAISDWIRDLKRSSSSWFKNKFRPKGDFHWQSGYGVFSVGRSEVETIKGYIRGQEAHHGTITFKEEYRRLLKQHEVEFDERYVWD